MRDLLVGTGAKRGIMVTTDPRATIAAAPMRRRQILIVALCVLLNALDGFDVLAISFASPGIAAEWSVDRAALGIVLSMELIGMTAGSLGLGYLCDRIGRRPTVIVCLAIMVAGMALATAARDIQTLSLLRLLTGVGIGGMLAATAAMVAEWSSSRARSLAVALMAGGYPAGAVLGGTIASLLLVDGSWRSVFAFGAIASGACLPIVWFLLPETIPWLVQRQPTGALVRVNAELAKLGHNLVATLPVAELQARNPLRQLFAPGLALVTLLLTLAYFAHILTFYFVLKWTPKIVADMGFAPSAAGGVLVWANVGGVTGAIILSLLTRRIGVRALTIGAMFMATVFVAAFGRSPANLGQLALLAGGAGFCTNGAVVGLYAIFAQSFPTEVRATGTGFAIGIGRGGAALSPIVAGYLFAGGVGLPTVALLMALGSTLGAMALLALHYRSIAAVPPNR